MSDEPRVERLQQLLGRVRERAREGSSAPRLVLATIPDVEESDADRMVAASVVELETDTLPDTSDGELLAILESIPPPSVSRSSLPPPTVDAAVVAVARAPTGTLIPPLDGSVPPIALGLPSTAPASPRPAGPLAVSSSAAPARAVDALRAPSATPAAASSAPGASRPPSLAVPRASASSASSLPPLAAPRSSRPAATSAPPSTESSLSELLDHHATERPEALPTSIPPSSPSLAAELALSVDEATPDSAPPTRTDAAPNGRASVHAPIVVPAPTGARVPSFALADDEPPSYGNTLVGGWREPGLRASAPPPREGQAVDPRTLVGLHALPGEPAIAARSTQPLASPSIVAAAPAVAHAPPPRAPLTPQGHEPRLAPDSARASLEGRLVAEPRSFGAVLDAALAL